MITGIRRAGEGELQIGLICLAIEGGRPAGKARDLLQSLYVLVRRKEKNAICV